MESSANICAPPQTLPVPLGCARRSFCHLNTFWCLGDLQRWLSHARPSLSSWRVRFFWPAQGSRSKSGPVLTEVGVGVSIGRKREEQSCACSNKDAGYGDSCSSKAGAHIPRSELPKSDSEEPACCWVTPSSVFKEMNALARVARHQIPALRADVLGLRVSSIGSKP